jgi:hypothetical protein
MPNDCVMCAFVRIMGDGLPDAGLLVAKRHPRFRSQESARAAHVLVVDGRDERVQAEIADEAGCMQELDVGRPDVLRERAPCGVRRCADPRSRSVGWLAASEAAARVPDVGNPVATDDRVQGGSHHVLLAQCGLRHQKGLEVWYRFDAGDKFLRLNVASIKGLANVRLASLASAASDPEFFKRIMVNYLRHELTDYERRLDMIAGQIGCRDAPARLFQPGQRPASRALRHSLNRLEYRPSRRRITPFSPSGGKSSPL